MPHFVIDCSPNVLTLQAIPEVLKTIHDTANATQLFKESDIKVRMRPFEHYLTSGNSSDFIHVFAYIMEGRNTQQKSDLSKAVVSKLKALYPTVPVISMNIIDFEKATYCNLALI